MKASDWIAIVATGIALIGVAVSIAALYFARRDAQAARVAAETAREDAAKAAERAERATVALEQQPATAHRLRRMETGVPEIDLRVEVQHDKVSDGFSVRNAGYGTAHDVTFQIDPYFYPPNPTHEQMWAGIMQVPISDPPLVDLQGGEATGRLWIDRDALYRRPKTLLVFCREWDGRARRVAVPELDA